MQHKLFYVLSIKLSYYSKPSGITMYANAPVRNHTVPAFYARYTSACFRMNRLMVAIIIMFVAGCSPTAPQQTANSLPNEQGINAAAELPDNVSKIISRLNSCVQFSNELSEEHTQRDKEIVLEMSALHCDTIEKEVDAVGKQYAGNKAVSNALHLSSDVAMWALIPGGSWQPTEKMVMEMRKNVKGAVQQHAAQHKINVPNWFTYSFQYQGQTDQEKKIIFINAICEKPPETFKTEFMFVDDGGACFFEAKYDPVGKTFDYIWFHLPYP